MLAESLAELDKRLSFLSALDDQSFNEWLTQRGTRLYEEAFLDSYGKSRDIYYDFLKRIKNRDEFLKINCTSSQFYLSISQEIIPLIANNINPREKSKTKERLKEHNNTITKNSYKIKSFYYYLKYIKHNYYLKSLLKKNYYQNRFESNKENSLMELLLTKKQFFLNCFPGSEMALLSGIVGLNHNFRQLPISPTQIPLDIVHDYSEGLSNLLEDRYIFLEILTTYLPIDSLEHSIIEDNFKEVVTYSYFRLLSQLRFYRKIIKDDSVLIQQGSCQRERRLILLALKILGTTTINIPHGSAWYPPSKFVEFWESSEGTGLADFQIIFHPSHENQLFTAHKNHLRSIQGLTNTQTLEILDWNLNHEQNNKLREIKTNKVTIINYPLNIKRLLHPIIPTHHWEEVLRLELNICNHLSINNIKVNYSVHPDQINSFSKIQHLFHNINPLFNRLDDYSVEELGVLIFTYPTTTAFGLSLERGSPIVLLVHGSHGWEEYQIKQLDKRICLKELHMDSSGYLSCDFDSLEDSLAQAISKAKNSIYNIPQ